MNTERPNQRHLIFFILHYTQQTQNICAVYIENVLPNICEMLLKIFIDVKMFDYYL